MARNTIASDAFAASIDGSWANGEGDWDGFTWLSSGLVRVSVVGNDCALVRNTGTYPRSQWSKVTVAALVSTVDSYNVLGSLVLGAISTDESAYLGVLRAHFVAGITYKYEIYETNSAYGFTTLGTAGTNPTSYAAGSYTVLETNFDGTTNDLDLYSSEGGGAETLRLSVSDATITSGRPGVTGFVGALGATTNSELSAWEGGDFSGGSAVDAAGTSTVVMSGAATATGALASDGTGALNAVGAATATGAVSMSGSGDLQAVGAMVIQGAVSIDSTSDVQTVGASQASGAASSTGTSDLQADGASTATGAAYSEGTGDAQLVGDGPGAVASEGAVSMSGSGDLQAVGASLAGGDVSIDGIGALNAVGAGGDIIVDNLGARPEPWRRERGRRKREIEEENEELTVLMKQIAPRFFSHHQVMNHGPE